MLSDACSTLACRIYVTVFHKGEKLFATIAESDALMQHH